MISAIRKRLTGVHRIVVKVGTNLLRGSAEGLNLDFMSRLAEQVTQVKARGLDVILVSSGAVGAGTYVLGLQEPPMETGQRQALAAIGQSRLMHHYELCFGAFNVRVAQVLLTRDSLDDRKRYLNARNTFQTLLGWGVLPIVNENDTIAVEELKFGDNDQLSALIAGKIGADLLIILTDVAGIFDRLPTEPGARRIPYLPFHRQTRIDIGSGEASSFGLGGMRSKLESVRLATRAGILSVIAPGREESVLLRLLEGEELGTWCEPQGRISARKRWLALGKRPGKGRIQIDAGAETALRTSGRSLLPSGVQEIFGSFACGELVRVIGRDGEEVALGLSRYDSADLERIKGKKTAEIASEMGKRPNYEVIHRDDMVLLLGGTGNGW